MAFVTSLVAALPRPSARPRAAAAKRRRPAVASPHPVFSPLPAPTPAPAPQPPPPPPPPPPPRRKPYGYWNDLSNVQRELQQVAAQAALPARTMPRIAQLQRLGRGDLLAALAKHGGVRRVAALLRWSRPAAAGTAAAPPRGAVRSALRGRAPRPRSAWRDDDALAQEFRRVATQAGCAGCMPTRRVLLQMRRSDLVNAAAKRGGLGAFALTARLSARAPVRRSGYWRDFEHVASHLRAFSEQWCGGRMPTAAELVERGMSSLSNAVAFHGGFDSVAARLRLAKRSGGRGAPKRWTRRKLVAEIELFVNTCMPRLAKERVLPTEAQLRRFGRNDLSYAIAKFGGFEKVAALCGMKQRVCGPFQRVHGQLVAMKSDS